MNAFNMSFRLNVFLHTLHRILDEELTVLKLGVIEQVVAGNVPIYLFLFASVHEQLLSFSHEVVVAQIAADYHIAAFNERTQCRIIAEFALGNMYSS
jgi:hypothetical protein